MEMGRFILGVNVLLDLISKRTAQLCVTQLTFAVLEKAGRGKSVPIPTVVLEYVQIKEKPTTNKRADGHGLISIAISAITETNPCIGFKDRESFSLKTIHNV